MLLRVVNAESCSQSFAEGYQRMGTHFVVGKLCQHVRETIPALKPSVVHFESNSDMSLPLCSMKEEPEEQARDKDGKTEGV